MNPPPRALDYFRLGCVAGNFVVIFAEKGLRWRMLDCLCRVGLDDHEDLSELVQILQNIPDDFPNTPVLDGHQKYLTYCGGLGLLKNIIRSEGNRDHFQWYTLGDALYRLAGNAGLSAELELDERILAFQSALAHVKPPRSIQSIGDNFIRLAKRRRGDYGSVFRGAEKAERLVVAYLDTRFE